MALRDEENFAYIDMSRPVSGIDHFLASVRVRGQRVFGSETTGIITEPNEFDADAEVNGIEDDEFGPPILKIDTIGIPRLKTYDTDDIRLTLLHRRRLLTLNGTSRFDQAGRHVTRYEERVYKPIDPTDDTRTSSLYQDLFRIGLKYDIPSQDAVEMSFSAISLNPDPDFDSKGIEIALVPAPAERATLMLAEQIGACFRSLAGESMSAAYPTSGPVALNVPFARLPRETNPEELGQFMKVIDDMLPLRGILGAIRPRPTVHN